MKTIICSLLCLLLTQKTFTAERDREQKTGAASKKISKTWTFSKSPAKGASIVQLEGAVDDLKIFPEVLIKLISGYAQPQKWSLTHTHRITQLPEGARIREPWAVSRDNVYAALGIRDERSPHLKIRIFDLRKIAPEIKLLKTNIRRDRAYHAHASFSTDNTLLAITEPKHHTQIWDTTTWTVINEISHTCDQPTFLPHSTTLAVGRRNAVELIESTTGEEINKIVHSDREDISVDAIETTSDKTILASALSLPLGGCGVELACLKTLQQIKIIPILRFHPRSDKLLLSPNNKFMLLKEWGGDNDLHALDNDNARSKRLLAVPNAGTWAWSHDADWAQFLPDNESIAFIKSATEVHTITISEHAKFRKNTKCLLNHPPKAGIKFFTVSPCGTLIITAGKENIYVWKLRNTE